MQDDKEGIVRTVGQPLMLAISPTRELAEQLANEVPWFTAAGGGRSRSRRRRKGGGGGGEKRREEEKKEKKKRNCVEAQQYGHLTLSLPDALFGSVSLASCEHS